MSRRSGFGEMSKGTTIRILIAAVVAFVLGYVVYKSMSKQTDTSAPYATPSPSASDSAPAKAASITYTTLQNTIGSNAQFNCPGAKGVSGDGSWCQFASEADAREYCNSNPDCTGYSKGPGGNFQVTTGTDQGPNTQWTFYKKSVN